jgi:hypothetical protein
MVDDASSLRYQHRHRLLGSQLRECEEHAAFSRAKLREIDAQEAPIAETLHDLALRVANRASVAAVAEAMERRAEQLRSARRALEAELKAFR